MRRRWSRRLAAGSTVLLVAIPLTALGTDGARAEGSFDAFARADGFEQTISNSSIPTGIDVEGGGPEARAHQTSFGISDATAQTPYTGGTVPGLPGTAGGLLGIPVPTYPFLVSTNSGDEPKSVSYPGMTLSAESGDFSTRASAMVGSDGSGAVSTAKVTAAADGGVTVEASTIAGSLKIGPYAEISQVRTIARVRADAFSGKLTRSSTTSIGRISAPGLVLTLPSQTPGALPAPPGAPDLPAVPTLPVPAGGTTLHDPAIGVQDGSFTVTLPQDGTQQKFAVPAGPVLDALKAQGVRMTFQAPELTKTGIIAGTYTFQYTVPAPPENSYYNGPTTVTQKTGFTVASMTFRAVQSANGGSFGGPLGGTIGDATDAAAPATGVSDGPGLGSPASDLVAPPTIGAAPEMSSPATQPAFTVAGIRIGTGIGNLYVLLVIIALVGYVSATVLRLSGVRFLWSS